MTQPEKTTPIGESPSPHAEARRAFPAGLEQPEGSFRFSVDALLLAAFAASRTTDVTIRFIDLGTGCGVVGLAYLLLKRNICQGFGMDCNPELIAAAQNNTAKLGFSDRFALHTGELADTRFLENLRMEASPVQLVMANPPWRLVGSGRLPATEARRKALFGDKGTFPHYAFGHIHLNFSGPNADGHQLILLIGFYVERGSEYFYVGLPGTRPIVAGP